MLVFCFVLFCITIPVYYVRVSFACPRARPSRKDEPCGGSSFSSSSSIERAAALVHAKQVPAGLSTSATTFNMFIYLFILLIFWHESSGCSEATGRPGIVPVRSTRWRTGNGLHKDAAAAVALIHERPPVAEERN